MWSVGEKAVCAGWSARLHPLWRRNVVVALHVVCGWAAGSSLAVLCGLECPAAPVNEVVSEVVVRGRLSVL